MNRQEKQVFIDDMHQALEAAEIVVVVHALGLDAEQTRNLRDSMNKTGTRFKFSQNKLTKLAVKKSKYAMIEALFSGPTAVATSSDIVGTAKAIAAFANQNEKFKIVGGAMGGKSLSEAEVKQLATLPSLDQLRGKLIGLLQAPATKLATLLQTPARQIAQVTKARSEQSA